MQVKLTYFKPSGKMYSEATYMTEKSEMFDIFEQVRQMLNDGNLPELVIGAVYDVLVEVPDHPQNHKGLIRCKQN